MLLVHKKNLYFTLILFSLSSICDNICNYGPTAGYMQTSRVNDCRMLTKMNYFRMYHNKKLLWIVSTATKQFLNLGMVTKSFFFNLDIS